MKKPPFVILIVLLASVLVAFDNDPNANNISAVVIVSPYSGIDWQNYGQYKAALHVHTSNSDGRNTLREVIEDHYEKGYDILAITEHNVLTKDWLSAKNGLTQERFDAIASGEGRNGRGMLQIPYTNEQSRSEHLNTFFVNYNNRRCAALKKNLREVERQGGISHINHPGRYTGGAAGGTAGENASNDSRNIRKYVDLFMNFPSCVGMEIINRRDQESASDRILWDNILAQTIPQGRYVWGFSNDDSHSNNNTGYSFNVFIMPENTLENFKATMLSGSFFAVARTARRELGGSFVGAGPVPSIVYIEVDNIAASITIAAENYNKIEWISAGEVIASGNVVMLETHRANINFYIRANVIGDGGIVFTQPFGVIWN
jgi:hypothetical protein